MWATVWRLNSDAVTAMDVTGIATVSKNAQDHTVKHDSHTRPCSTALVLDNRDHEDTFKVCTMSSDNLHWQQAQQTAIKRKAFAASELHCSS